MGSQWVAIIRQDQWIAFVAGAIGRMMAEWGGGEGGEVLKNTYSNLELRMFVYLKTT